MENKNNTEDINDIQTYVVTRRNKYCKKISEYYEQNAKIDLKLLEKRTFKHEARFEVPKELTLEENLLTSLTTDLVDKERINMLRDRLKNLDKFIIQEIRMKNCSIYKQEAAEL